MSVYGDTVKTEVFGKSVKGRSLYALTAGNGKRSLLVIGGIHGREFVSSAFIMRCVFSLLCSENSRKLLEKNTVFVCPMTNPDGVEIALGREKPSEMIKGFEPQQYKNNANNVNLNANFPFKHRFVPKERQGGSKGASEPETKAIMELCRKERFASSVSIHARGNCIYWRDSANNGIYGDFYLADLFKNRCGFDLMTPTLSIKDYSGGFENWFRDEFRRPSLCVELVKDEDLGFSQLCTRFDEAVLWDKTGSFLEVYLGS